jgi:hypothetical protein
MVGIVFRNLHDAKPCPVTFAAWLYIERRHKKKKEKEKYPTPLS